MSRWFRHYAGMMRDDKLVRVAIRSKQTIERVVWVYGAILESASEVNQDGTYDVDAAEIAYFLRADEADIDSIFSSLEGAGHIAGGRVAKWSDRQFKSDSSADRQAAYRQRKRDGNPGNDDAAQSPDAGVTSPSRHRDAPETETELETEVTPIAPLEGGRRGKTLIPVDWKAPPVSELPPRSRACAEQWTEASYETEAEGFLLYWRAERKMKADWGGTWANRIITRNSAVMRDQKYGNAAPETVKPMSAEQSKAYAERYAAQLEAEGRKREAADYRRRYSVSVGEVAAKIVRTA